MSAVDSDPLDTVSYSLTDDAGGRFVINPQTGQVTVATDTALDYETESRHQIEIKATSTDGTESVSRFALDVLDQTEVRFESGDQWLLGNILGNVSGGPGTDTIISDQSLAEVTTSTIDLTSVKISLAPESKAFTLSESDESFTLTLSDLGYQSDIWRTALNRLVEARAIEVGGLVGQVVLPLDPNQDGTWFDEWSLTNQTTLQIVDADGALMEDYLPTYSEARAEAESILQAFEFDQADVGLSSDCYQSSDNDADLSRLTVRVAKRKVSGRKRLAALLFI